MPLQSRAELSLDKSIRFLSLFFRQKQARTVTFP